MRKLRASYFEIVKYNEHHKSFKCERKRKINSVSWHFLTFSGGIEKGNWPEMG